MRKWWLLALVLVLLGGAAAVTVAVLDGRSQRPQEPDGLLTVEADPIGKEVPELKGRATAPGEAVGTTPQDAGPWIAGVVVSESGAPIVGADVYAIPASLRQPLIAAGIDASSAVSVAVSTADGAFQLPLRNGSETHTVVARTVGGLLAARHGVRAGAQVRLVVSDPARLSGRVLDMAARPVTDAALTVQVTLDALTFSTHTHSDESGRYALRGIPVPPADAGARAVWHVALMVEHKGFAPLYLETGNSGSTHGLPQLLPGMEATIDLVLIRGATVQGVVLEEDTDRPVAGARVVVWSMEGGGRLKRPGGTRLRTGAYGRILAETESATDGTFAVPHVPARGFHQLSVRGGGGLGPIFGNVSAIKEGFVPGHHEVPVLLDEAALETTIRLWPGATLTGRVVGSDGEPVAGVEMWAWSEGRHDQYQLPPALRHLSTSLSRTGPDGVFRVAGIRASRRRPVEVELMARRFLAFRGQGHFVAEQQKVKLSVRAGDVKDLGDIVLKAPKAPRVEAVVLDAAGAPVAGAVILCWEPHQRIKADAEGRATLYWPESWTYVTEKQILLQVSAPGHATTFAQVQPALGDVTETRIALPAGTTIAGLVVDAQNRAVAGAGVTVSAKEGIGVTAAKGMPWAGYLATGTTDSEGRFHVADLPAGPFRVSAALAGLGGGSSDTETGEQDVEIRMQGALADIARSVEDDTPGPAFEIGAACEGRPVALVEMELVSGGNPVGGTRIRPGRVRFEGVPDGTYAIRATAPGFTPFKRAGVRVVRGRPEAPIELELSRGVVVSGRVTKHGGSSVNHTLSFMPEAGASATRITVPIRADGTYEASGLAPGRYRVVSLSLADWNPKLPSMAHAGNQALLIAKDAHRVTFDVSLHPGGVLSVVVPGVKTDALPRLVLLDEAQRKIIDAQVPENGWAAGFGYAVMLPGTYTIRLHESDGTAKEKVVRVEAGKKVSVRSFD